MKISHKLSLLNAGIFVALSAYCWLECSHDYDNLLLAQNSQMAAQSVANRAKTIHALQTERGRSAGVLALKNEKNLHELQAAQSRCNQLGCANIPTITKARAAVQNSDSTAIALYSEVIFNELVEIKKSTDALNFHYQNLSAGLYLLNEIKENYGQLRALLNAVFNKNSMSQQEFARASYLYESIKHQNAMLAALQDERFDEQMRNLHMLSEFQTAEEMIHNALKINTKGGFEISSAQWFAAATAAIDALNSGINQSAEAISNQAKTHAGAARSKIIKTITLNLATLLIFVLTSLLLSKNIASRLAQITRQLGEFFDYLNHKTAQANAQKLKGNDEFSKLSSALAEQISTLEQALRCDSECIAQIAQIAASIKAGRLHERASIRAHNPALQRLVSIINDMLAELNSKIGADINESFRLITSFQALDFSAHTASASGQIEAALNELGAQIRSMLQAQNQLSSELFSDVQSMNSSLNQIEQMGQNVQQSALAEQQTIAQMQAANAQLLDDCEQIHASSQQIATVADIIREIADESALLALNAGIESARAGVHGRGFAVLAGETSKLAASTQAQVAQVEAQIKQLGAQVQRVLASARTASKELARVSADAGAIYEAANQNAQLVAAGAAVAARVDNRAKSIHDDLQRTKY